MAAALDYLGSERGFSETLGDPDARMALGKLCCCEFKYRLTDDIQEIVRGLPPISGWSYKERQKSERKMTLRKQIKQAVNNRVNNQSNSTNRIYVFQHHLIPLIDRPSQRG